jgi:Putative Flp pilus-assembly TadE/G-like
MTRAGSAKRLAGEQGAVIVLVGLWLPVLALFVMFAIDVSHWFDYSRNLQARADAAALAAGAQYGDTCAATTPDATAMAQIAEAAQLYSGPEATSDLPYSYAQPLTDFSPTTYQNDPTLRAGTLDRYHVLINAPGPWQPGQTSNNNWPGQSGTPQSFKNGTVCAASYADDQGGKAGPITDVWVTQDKLPLFFPLLQLHPTISAHARVELQQGTGGDMIRPVAVRDSAVPDCVSVNFVTDDASHTIVKTWVLTKDPAGDPSNPNATLWDNPAGDPLPVQSANLIVQPVLGCGASAAVYNDTTNTGLLYINSYGTSTPGAGQAPIITTGGVTLGGSCTPDQYFSTQDCTASVTAHVAFAPAVPYGNETVTAVDTGTGNSLTLSKLHTAVTGKQTVAAGQPLTVDSTAGFKPSGSIDVNGASYAYSAIDATHFTLVAGGSFANNALVTQTGDTNWNSGALGLSFLQQTGQHPIRIDWTQTSGSVGGIPCGNGANACKNSLGVQQQGFSACSACDAPDDSDGIIAFRLHLPGATGGSGQQVFQRGTTVPALVAELELSGLTFEKTNPTSPPPPQVLRVGTSTDKATGLINCGQGSGANADVDAITNGCPLVNTPACNKPDYDFCAPLKVYDPALHTSKCNPLLRETSDPAYADCVATTQGTRRSKIPGAIAARIVVNGTCSANNWTAYNAGTIKKIPPGDPRAVLFIITKPGDLSKNSIVPIENFATFYVTGWDTSGSIPNCNPAGTNEAFPGKGKSSQNGAIWGHWIEYTQPGVFSNGTFCDPTLFGVCASVLTR